VKPPSVDLAGELALLTEANAAIRRGDATQASELLRAYDQRFPAGHLAEERAAAGILALCASGHPQSAIAEARRFVERWPRSPLVARIKASCAAEGRSP
jgi:outer membrane protein assembly factor BamD (BamD/ComL family)